MAEQMPFLVTATDARGSRDTFAREAASIEHLRTVLERDGYTDIEFVDDELSARLRAQRPDEGRPATAAEYRYEARVRQGAGAGDAWRMAARGALPVLVPAAVAIGWGAWSKPPRTSARRSKAATWRCPSTASSSTWRIAS